MAEYVTEPARIEFSTSGLSYALTGSLDAVAASDPEELTMGRSDRASAKPA